MNDPSSSSKLETCGKISTLFAIITILLLSTILYVWCINPSDSFLTRHERREMDCRNVTVYEPINGWIDFVVSMDFPVIHYLNYNKTPVVNGERFLKIGRTLIWHGTINVMEIEGISKTVFNFEEIPSKDQLDRFHEYYVSCPKLELKLSATATAMWKRIAFNKSIPTSTEDEALQKSRSLSCKYVHVYEREPLPLVGHFSVVIPNPVSKNDLVITKYPMYEKETIVLSGNDVYWYRTYDLLEKHEQTKMLFQFTQHSSDSVYYEMSCPILIEKINAVETNYWLVFVLSNFWSFVALLLIPCSVGCCCSWCCSYCNDEDDDCCGIFTSPFPPEVEVNKN